MKPLLALLCALVTLPAGAATIDDLKTAVNRLAAKRPVRGTYATELTFTTAGRFANQKSERTVSVEVTHDAIGVSIVIPQTLIDKASREALARPGAWDNDAQRAIGSIRSINVVEALDFRDSFLGLLKYGAVKEEKRVAFRGKTARLLVLALSEPPTRKENSIRIGSVKVDEDRLQVWVGDDNLPLAAERSQKTTAGFMMFRGTNATRTTYTFGHTEDRLILTRVETRGTGSGMGQKFEESSLQTMTLH